MTRIVALRASPVFVALTLVFGGVGFASGTRLAEALVLITGALCGLMVAFAAAGPIVRPIPVRVRRG